jgi:hypothetical protein
MKGTVIRINVDGSQLITPVKSEPSLEMMKEGIDGGYLEIIPRFNWINYDGVVRKCVAFCDEDGKIKRLPLNKAATIQWDRCLQEQGLPGLLTPDGQHMIDHLVGPILVVTGDKEFMEAL